MTEQQDVRATEAERRGDRGDFAEKVQRVAEEDPAPLTDDAAAAQSSPPAPGGPDE